MHPTGYAGKAAMAAASTSLLAGCTGQQALERAAEGSAPKRVVKRPASWTDLPVRAGARDVVHRSYELRITVKSLVRGSKEDMEGARVDRELRNRVLHYPTFQVTTAGRRMFPEADVVHNDLFLNSTDWTQGEKAYVGGGRPGGVDLSCAATAPTMPAPGDSYDTCATCVLPEGVGVLSLTHNADGHLDEGGAVATWPVEGGLKAASAGLAEPGGVFRVRWDAREDGVLELPATPVSVRRGDAAGLAALDLLLNENERRGVPYYVVVTSTDPGPKNPYPDQAGQVRLLTEGGRRIRGKTPHVLGRSGGKIPGCPSDRVARMVPPGDSVTECSVHLVTDDGDKPFAVGFAEAGRPGLVTWRAPLR